LKKFFSNIWQNKRQFLLGLAVIFLLLLLLDLNNRVGELYTLTRQRDQMRTSVVILQSTERELRKQIAYATSESAVEEWARQDNNYSQPGDKVIIPLAQPGFTPVPTIRPTPTTVVLENWEVWSLLFLGENPNKN
jgi:cell division protein FtsB